MPSNARLREHQGKPPMTAQAAPLQAKAPQAFTISRTFDAPRDLMWKVNTECEHLKHWWSPKGFTMRVCSIDLRPGGVFHYGLRSPEGQEIWGKIVYREIVAPERLVYVVMFSNEKGEVTRHPMSPSWPLTVLSTTTLTEHRSKTTGGKTTVTVEWMPYEASAEERATFDAGREDMRQGFTGTFDQLDIHLAKTR
jgi:uncharacterized protein YndB with AHSA1/START domain